MSFSSADATVGKMLKDRKNATNTPKSKTTPFFIITS
jgi:hypothetical protein